jgi:hypothetical protein
MKPSRTFAHILRLSVALAILGLIFAASTAHAGAAVASVVRTRVNGNANWSTPATWNYGLTGTITTTGTGTTVTGTGTAFQSEVQINDVLVKADGTELGTVISITDDSTLDFAVNATATYNGAFGSETVPDTDSDVEVGNATLGGNINLTLNVTPVTINSLKIADAGTGTQTVLRLDVNQLNVTTDVTLQTPSTPGATFNELTADTGTLNMRDLLLDTSPGDSNLQQTYLLVSDGVVNINRDVKAINGGEGEAHIENTGNGFLNLFGNFDGFNVYTAGGTNHVQYLGTGNQLIRALPYCNLAIGGNRGANNVTFEQGVHAIFANFDASATFTTGGYSQSGPFTVQLTGNAAQDITGTGANPLVIENLVLLSPPSVTISKDVFINGDLQLLSGKVISQTNKLTIGPMGSVSAANASRYINGNFDKIFLPGAGQIFVAPIGDNTHYTPVLVSSLNATQTGSLHFATSTPAHPNVASAGFISGNTVARFWTLSASNLLATFNATFTYPAAEAPQGSPDQFVLKRFAGNSWFSVQTGSASAGSIEGRNLDAASLGAFQAGQIPVVNIAAPQILSATATPDRVVTGETVQFSANASDPQSLPLTFSWDFGDGTTATGNPVSHAFSTEGNLTVGLHVSNGTNGATAQVAVTTIAPNSGGQGVPNITQGDPPATNPLNDFTVTVISSDGGVIQLAIDIDALIRANLSDFNVSTDFGGLGGRITTQTGLRPVAKVSTPGIIVATTDVKDAATGATKGKARKTIPVSAKEVGITRNFDKDPSNNIIGNASTKGAFSFGGGSKAKPDAVSFSGAIDLPVGLDLSQNQTFEFSIGNIVDSVVIGAKGKGSLPSAAKHFTKVAFKYPKLAKGSTKTTAGQSASFSVTISGTALSDAGFDTEGITNSVRADEKGLKAVPRSLQVAAIFAGVSYKLNANVQYSLSPKGDSGKLTGRAGH